MMRGFTREYLKVDKELVILFLLVAITALVFFFVSNQRAFLNFFYLPTLLGAYFYGKRYATLSAVMSIILIFLVAYTYPESFMFSEGSKFYKWLDIWTWGGFLMITGYCMGLLYEKKEVANEEIRRTYRGIIEMLSLIIDAVDQQTQSHSYRVSVVSELLARRMKLNPHEVENIRVAALLHDLGKIGISSEVLVKVGKLTESERNHIHLHTQQAVDILHPIRGNVIELLPIILNHHEKFDGSGYNSMVGDSIPLGARIIAVADVYDALTSDRPYRKAITPYQAKEEIITNSGRYFDVDVVRAFDQVFPTLLSDAHLAAVRLEN